MRIAPEVRTASGIERWAALAVVLVFSACDGPTTSTPGVSQPPSQNAAVDHPCKDIGEVCAIRKMFKTTDLVPVATSLRAYQEFRKSFLAGDTDGMGQMALTSEIIGPKAGDLARILDVSPVNDRAEVRIASGEYSGRKAWIALGWLRRQP